MPRPKPQVEIVKFNGHELSLKLKPKVPDKSSVLHTYTKYKNVVKEGRATFYAYTTIRGQKVYLGKHANELDAAIAQSPRQTRTSKTACTTLTGTWTTWSSLRPSLPSWNPS